MRGLLIVVAALGILLLAGFAGLAVSSRLAPEKLRVALESALGQEVGPIAIGAVRPYFAWGVGFELSDLRSTAANDGIFAADRIWITLGTRRLLRGEIHPRRVDVRGLRLAAVEGADGTWEPAALERLRARSRAGGDEPPARLRTVASELPALSIEDGTLRIARADGSVWALQLDHATLTHDPLGGAPELNAAGRLERPEKTGAPQDLGAFELAALLDDPAPLGTLAFTELALDALPAAWVAPLRAAGRVSGVASWSPATGGGAIDLEAIGLGLRLSRTDDDAASSFPTARLVARIEHDAHRVRVRKLEWHADSLALSGSVAIDHANGAATQLGFDLRGGPVAVATLRDLARLATVPGGADRRTIETLRAGEVESFTLRAAALPVGAVAAASAKPNPWPSGLALEAKVAGVEIHVSDDRPIRDLSGSFSIEGEQLRIVNARAKLGDRALPALTLALDGIGAARVALASGAVPPSVPALPGLGALDRWIDSLRRPGSPPRWRRIEVRADWIEHPALFRPLDEVTAVLMPANPGIHIRDAKGFWGGVPFAGTGSFYGGANPRVEVDVSLTPKRRVGSRRSDAGTWGRARFHADLEKLGDFQAESLEGVAQGIGDRVELRRGEARLRPRGDLTGTVDLDLSRGDAVPYRARIELAGGSLSDLMNDVKMDGGAARGTTEIDADLTGEIRAGRKPLADMKGTANLRLRGGEINKRMNVLFAIAQASDTLNPFRSRETIPFDELDAPLTLDRGVAATERFSLQGAAVRMVGTGHVDMVNRPNHVEAVLGVFFFRSLDRVIGLFPVLNRLLLGPDENLIATYFAVSGPWANPQGTLIPTKSIASGPASFVLEGLPAFVRGGLSTLERAFTAGPVRPVPVPVPPPAQAPPEPPPADAGGPS